MRQSKNTEILLGFWLFVILPFFMTACMPSPEAPIRIGTNPWPGYETLYLARELGYFKGIPVQLLEQASTTQTMDALRSGRIDMAALTLDEVLHLRTEGLDLVVVWVMNISHGADVLLAKPEIGCLAELKGKRVGVEYTALGAFMLDTALQRADLRRRDIFAVFLPINEQLDAFRQGKIDALVTFDPIRQALLKEGAKVLFDSSQIPGQVVDVLAVRKDRLEQTPNMLRRLVQAQQEGLYYLKQQPDDAYRLMAQRLGMNRAEVAEFLKEVLLPDEAENHRLLSGQSPLLGQSAKRMAEVMYKRGLLPLQPDVSSLVDGRLTRVGTETGQMGAKP